MTIPGFSFEVFKNENLKRHQFTYFSTDFQNSKMYEFRMALLSRRTRHSLLLTKGENPGSILTPFKNKQYLCNHYHIFSQVTSEDVSINSPTVMQL